MNLRTARMFTNTFRFIDDLIAINDGGTFEKSYKDIYPPELELKKENIGQHEASFLDLNIVVNNNNFDVCLFDKRDSFPFSIVRMPFMSSNMPLKIFYSSVGAEILRIAKANNNIPTFFNSTRAIIKRMLSQGGKLKSIINTLKKIFGQHFHIFRRFAPTSVAFVNNLIH